MNSSFLRPICRGTRPISPSVLRLFHSTPSDLFRPAPQTSPKPKPKPRSDLPVTQTKMVFKRKPNTSYPNNQFQARDERGNQKMSVRAAFENARYWKSAATPEGLPPKGKLQEVVFAGRSNTGKSSLLNALFSSTSLVKVSSKAGHTKMLNFFEIPDQFIMVDAPGYGERGRPEWGELFQYYVTERPPTPPSLVVILFPLNHGLLASDELFLAALPRSVSLLPVFTKTDLVPVEQIEQRVKETRQKVINSRGRAPLLEEGQIEGRTWEPLCVSVKKGWALRDETVDAVRETIITQLELTAKEHVSRMQQYNKEQKAARKAEAAARSWLLVAVEHVR
ncbi:Predicted GTPase [Phaffia rhodozyma]|uniref:Predicted GTPase n=1 Tax=Phaffia rhodozyma TaxID=264483 RepID=A0A0F7SWV0_PHARH|nr:Predicted GTPase [Phaffia rhodozyma]